MKQYLFYILCYMTFIYLFIFVVAIITGIPIPAPPYFANLHPAPTTSSLQPSPHYYLYLWVIQQRNLQLYCAVSIHEHGVFPLYLDVIFFIKVLQFSPQSFHNFFVWFIARYLIAFIAIVNQIFFLLLPLFLFFQVECKVQEAVLYPSTQNRI